MAGGVESDCGLFALIESGGARDDDQRTRPGQPCLQGFEGIDFYVALVAASVVCVRLFGVGKRGGVLDCCTAALCA